jgi:hypothetical protein
MLSDTISAHAVRVHIVRVRAVLDTHTYYTNTTPFSLYILNLTYRYSNRSGLMEIRCNGHSQDMTGWIVLFAIFYLRIWTTSIVAAVLGRACVS